MQMRTRYQSRVNALEDLGNLWEDLETVACDAEAPDEPDLDSQIVLKPELAQGYKSTALTLLHEGRNLLAGKPTIIQKIGGSLLRVHFSNEELDRARWIK